MTNDALDPSSDGSYPFVPRNADGTADPVRFPRGLRKHKDPKTGRWILIDVTPTRPDGSVLVPADIPPTPPSP